MVTASVICRTIASPHLVEQITRLFPFRGDSARSLACFRQPPRSCRLRRGSLGDVARALRLDFAGATWHLHNRGNNRQDIFLCDRDRLQFLDFLAETIRRYKWVLHEYELMTNHYHLVIDTPEPTVSRGMQ
jgi:hypothetical protein